MFLKKPDFVGNRYSASIQRFPAAEAAVRRRDFVVAGTVKLW